MLLEEFDKCTDAVLNPTNFVKPIDNIPPVLVSCFERGTFVRMLERYGGTVIAQHSVANMEIPVYETEYNGVRLALMLMDVGAPVCAGLCEELYAMSEQCRQPHRQGQGSVARHDLCRQNQCMKEF